MSFSALRRFSLLIEKIRGGQYPSFEELTEYLESHEFKVLPRTIQRDLEKMRYDFNLVINYDRNRNGYYIDEESSLNVKSFYRFLEIVSTAELLTESLKENSDSLNFISFDSGAGLKGIEFLQPLLRATKDKHIVQFDHLNFHTGNIKTIRMHPYLLKEYQNRWYLIGLVEGSTEQRTFGIDRITNLEVLTDTFERDKKLDPKANFEDIIGIVYSLNEKQRVVLSFDPLQGEYVKSLPLHPNQIILEDNKKELRIALDVIPNYELSQQILMLGDRVKVIEPEWLVKEIKEKLQLALNKY